MLDQILTLRTRLLDHAAKAAWLAPLLARLTVGVVFLGTGWGKLHSLDEVTKFFTELHLPAPHFQALLVATTEFAGGLCILLGLMTRLAALPLLTTMVVAIATAKRDELTGLSSLLGLEEWSYLVLFAWLALAGPGKASLDHLLGRLTDGKRARATPALPVGSPARG